jgi:nitrite reductase/ring-hydroxylating ferredoxin subunit
VRVVACSLADLPPGSSTVVTAADRSIAVFNVDGDIVAIDNLCAHRQQPLADGVVRDGIVTCPAHLWRYDLRTGERVDASGVRQACFAVTVEDGVIRVDVPEPEPRPSIRDMLLEHAREWSRDA